LEKIECDLFKADVYSMGLTLYAIASGDRIEGLNSSPDKENLLIEKVEKLNLPLCIKHIILHMLAFNPERRIPTFSLYRCLREI